VHSGRYATATYNFEDPTSDFEASSDTIITSPKLTGLESYDYSGRFGTSDEGKKLSERRMQALESAAFRATGESSIPWMQAGMGFALADHPVESLNASYLVTGVEHRIQQELRKAGAEDGDLPSYTNSFTAVPDERPYRPPRVTPWPRIAGSQTAIVVGPDGEEIHTDPHGRVKVRFHWDRWGAKNDTDLQEWDTSCWVRVAQNSAGKGWGSFYLPRVGQEVVVEFLDGDPDRPLVTGTVYNGATKLPYDTKEKKTISGVKTMTVGGGGFNEIRFDDETDEEQVFVHAQKNYDVRVLNDAYEVVKNNRHQLVEKDRLVEVRNESHETIAKDHRVKVGKDHHLEVKGKQAIAVTESRSLKVTGDLIEEVGGDHSEKTTGDIYVKGANIVIEASQMLSLKVGGNSVVVDASGVTVKGSLVTVDGSMVKIASGPGTSPGSGSAGSLVPPATPILPEEADEADPGDVDDLRREQREKEEGKYGNPAWVAPPPFDDPSQDPAEDPDRTWIAIIVFGEDGKPIPGVEYEVEDHESRLYRGTTPSSGEAREYVKKGGDPKVRFPKLDQDAIEKK
jgi:type VI secretion system secreted protein VgrG